MEARLQVAVEREVDIDLVVAGAVERPHRRLAGAAGGRRRAGKQHQLRILILLPEVRKISRQVSSVEASTFETKRAMSSSAGGRCAGRSAAAAPNAVPDRPGRAGSAVDAEQIAADQGDEDRADAETATDRQAETTTATAAAAVLKIVAFALVVEAHAGVSGTG